VTGVVTNAPNDGSCADGNLCNGVETCDAVNDCEAGTPVDPDDGVGCTDDSCDPVTGVVTNAPNDGSCADGNLCNGVETCDAVNDCESGTPIDPDDSVGCTDDSCDPGTGAVTNTPNDANCDDALACTGTETCDATQDCVAGTPPVLSSLYDNGSYADLNPPTTVGANAFSPAAVNERGSWAADGILDFFTVADPADVHCAFEWHMTGGFFALTQTADFDTARLRFFEATAPTSGTFSNSTPVADIVVSQGDGTLSTADTGDDYTVNPSFRIVTFTADLADVTLPAGAYAVHVSFPNNTGGVGFWHNAPDLAPDPVCAHYWGTSTIAGDGAAFDFENATDICTIRGVTADNVDFRLLGL
jgi:hypothetical protein